MNVLSLFDGMSCGQLALQRSGIQVNKYYASEIDKYAIKIAQKNFPNTVQLGDVVNVKSHHVDKIDLLIGGSPCQGFSFAGKQLNFDDPRSKLFFEFVRLLNELKPKYFLLENVKMKKESEDVITKYLGVKPIMINSALVSAQNRQRLYWTNIPGITQPEDKGILLKDILEDGYVTDEMTTKDNKSYAITATYNGAVVENSITRKQRTMIAKIEKPIRVGTAVDIKGYDILKRVYSPDGKSPTLTTMQGGHREPKIICGAYRGRYNQDGSIKQNLELRKDDKTNSLTTVQKDNVLITDKSYWRKLTPIECERLQTVPDNYTKGVSNTQRYKMLGNGWTIDVIAHIFKNIKEVNNV